MKRRLGNNILLTGSIMVLIASIVLAIASLFPIASINEETRVLIDDSFELSPLEIRRHGLGSFRGGENISLLITETMNLPINYSVVTYGGMNYTNETIGNVEYSFVTGADYYEVVFFGDPETAKNINFKVLIQEPIIHYPFSWLNTPAKALFFSSLGFLTLMLAKSAMTEASETNSHKLNMQFFNQRNRKKLLIALLLSLAFWFFLLMINSYPFATFENWYTDHLRHPYSANLFTKVGFSIFDTPLGKLASQDNSYYKFVTWPEMPHLYPLGSVFLFLPFGMLLEQAFPRVFVSKMEIALFLVVSHICLYYFIPKLWNLRINRPLKLLAMYLFYIVLVMYSANGMFDTVALLFSMIALAMYMTNRYDQFILYAAVSMTFKYQAGIFLFPLILLSLLKLFEKSSFWNVAKNKVILFAAALVIVDLFTAYLSAPFLASARPELVMNGVNAFSPHAQLSWEIQSAAVLLTLAVTLLSAVYLLHKSSLNALFSIYALLPCFTMPYFQPWYLPFFFVYALFPKDKRATEVTLLWLVFMVFTLSFGGLSYSPLHILNSIQGVLSL